ncbi:YceI family protein [Cellulomonas sp. JZ18]|uniref:YceI family protein n=1 Tax=Cellulomonas sp. JZ18 TaxID=2654191 RepID=UPI0012D3E479|nr:YceI family protein [Cellulomonas sp. JZ18]QGQ18467.1 YceI family protein [Cellulomonas sp. JZ18]
MTDGTQEATRRWKGMTIPAAGTYVLDAAHKRVGFVAHHMMVSQVRGEFTAAAATIRVGEDPLDSAVTATIRTATLSTQNEDRDTHLRSSDFLDVERWPTIEFRSRRVERRLADDAIAQWARLRNHLPERSRVATEIVERTVGVGGRFTVVGDLTIRDVTREVALDMHFGGAKRDPYGRDIFGFSATTDFNREDFGLEWNVALEAGGWLVGKRVRVEIAGEAVREL